MEGQTATAPAPESAAPPPASAPVDVGTLSEGDYVRQRSDYEAKNGRGSWIQKVASEAPAAQQNAAAAPGEGEPPAAAQPGDDDLEPGEVTINADGKAIDSKTGRFVPKSAYLRVKGEVGELKGTTEQLRTQLIQAKERLSIYAEATTAPAAAAAPAKEAPKRVDPAEDLFAHNAYLEHTVGELQKRLEQIEGKTTATQQGLENRDLQQYAKSDAEAFAAKTPDFSAALQHVSAALEKAAVRFGATPEEAKTEAVKQIHAFINQNRGAKKSWASEAYDWAKEIGYAPKPAGGGETAEQKAAREEVERINAGKAASTSLRGAGGNGVGEQVTREKLATMPEGEYFNTKRAYVAKHGVDGWNRLIGG